MKAAGLFLASLVLSIGCSSLQVPQTPSIELASLDFREPSLTAATLMVGLRVDNPNNFAIPLGNLSYALHLNGVDFAKGNLNEPGRLPAKQAKVIEVPIRVSYLSLLRTAKAGVETGRVSYQIRGALGTRLGSHPFSSEGNLDLPKELGSSR